MDWLQYIAAPLLMLIGGAISWLMKCRLEELKAVKEKLREERRKTYLQILEPYILLFSDIKGKGQDLAHKKFISKEYRAVAFELNFFGSDEVVNAHNRLWKHIYENENVEIIDANEKLKRSYDMMRLWGGLLLEIRKDLGNRKTKLKEKDMLHHMIKDIDHIVEHS
jgi:hypothetical protein